MLPGVVEQVLGLRRQGEPQQLFVSPPVGDDHRVVGREAVRDVGDLRRPAAPNRGDRHAQVGVFQVRPVPEPERQYRAGDAAFFLVGCRFQRNLSRAPGGQIDEHRQFVGPPVAVQVVHLAGQRLAVGVCDRRPRRAESGREGIEPDSHGTGRQCMVAGIDDGQFVAGGPAGAQHNTDQPQEPRR